MLCFSVDMLGTNFTYLRGKTLDEAPQLQRNDAHLSEYFVYLLVKNKIQRTFGGWETDFRFFWNCFVCLSSVL